MEVTVPCFSERQTHTRFRDPSEHVLVMLSLMRSPGEGRRVNWEVLGKSQDELR